MGWPMGGGGGGGGWGAMCILVLFHFVLFIAPYRCIYTPYVLNKHLFYFLVTFLVKITQRTQTNQDQNQISSFYLIDQ